MEQSRRIFFITVCFVAANVAVGAWFLLRGGKSAQEALASPVLAIEALEAKSLFFNDAARPFLLESKSALLTEEDKEAHSQRSRAFSAAANDPKLWRELDRRYRFDTVLLIGDPGTYRLLLQHLFGSADWPLSHLDHTGYIFRRAPADAWTVSKLEPLKERFEKTSAASRGEFLTQLAAKLSAVNQHTAAKSCLDEALAIDGKSPAAWTQFGVYHAHFAQWNEALTKFDKALAVDPEFLPALAGKAQALVAVKRTDAAFEVSERIYRAAPKDPAMLFLVAKVSHAAHAFWREVEALKKLIELAERDLHPVSGYRIYLAQAYASLGEAEPALAEFQKALEDPNLSAEQRKFVMETIETIKSNVSM